MQVALWYQGWKDRFPEVLRSDPRVMAQFSAALTLMDQVCWLAAIRGGRWRWWTNARVEVYPFLF